MFLSYSNNFQYVLNQWVSVDIFIFYLSHHLYVPPIYIYIIYEFKNTITQDVIDQYYWLTIH